MMMKINSNYNPNFTVEDLLEQVTFLKRFRIPFIFFGFLSIAAYIIYVSLFLAQNFLGNFDENS